MMIRNRLPLYVIAGVVLAAVLLLRYSAGTNDPEPGPSQKAPQNGLAGVEVLRRHNASFSNSERAQVVKEGGKSEVIEFLEAFDYEKALSSEDFNFLAGNLMDIPVEDFDSVWDFINNLKTQNHKKFFLLSQCLKVLVSAGQVDRAFGIATEGSPNSERHSGLVRGLFSSENLSFQELVKLRSSIADQASLDSANEGISAKFNYIDSLTDVDLGAFDFNNSDDIKILAKGLKIYLDNASRGGEDQFDECVALCKKMDGRVFSASNGEEERGLLGDFLLASVFSYPDEVLGSLSQGLDLTAEAGKKIAKRMVEVDPEGALKLSFKDPQRFGNSFELFGVWLANDDVAAREWFASNPKLEIEQREGIYGALAVSSGEAGDFRAAVNLIGQIEDENVRKNAENKVWWQQRREIEREVQKNGIETLDAIASGDSQFSQPWLETAMGELLKNDFDLANTWYEENWNLMSEDKAQYVAAAFAKQAANEGNVLVAKQWVGYIKDDEVLQRIQSLISKSMGDQ